jgi:hypothetical protein
MLRPSRSIESSGSGGSAGSTDTTGSPAWVRMRKSFGSFWNPQMGHFLLHIGRRLCNRERDEATVDKSHYAPAHKSAVCGAAKYNRRAVLGPSGETMPTMRTTIEKRARNKTAIPRLFSTVKHGSFWLGYQRGPTLNWPADYRQDRGSDAGNSAMRSPNRPQRCPLHGRSDVWRDVFSGICPLTDCIRRKRQKCPASMIEKTRSGPMYGLAATRPFG